MDSAGKASSTGCEKMRVQTGYIRSVKALPGYKLEVEMTTDTRIEFDFASRLNTIRFGALKDEKLFVTASTDGNFITFGTNDAVKVRISAIDFMDLVLVDRTGRFPPDET